MKIAIRNVFYFPVLALLIVSCAPKTTLLTRDQAYPKFYGDNNKIKTVALSVLNCYTR